MSRLLRMIGLTLAALLVLLAGFAAWVLNSEAGARWVAARAVGMFDGKLQVASVAGHVAGPLTLRGVVYADAGLGVDARVDEVSVDVVLGALLSRTVRVGALDVSGVEVRLSEPQQQEEPPPGQFSLQPPIDIVLDRLMLRDARVLRDGEELIAIRSAEASGGWTAAQGVQIANLTVDAADGHVQLAGSVQDQNGYVGQLSGNFDWRAGPSQWAGDLTAASAGGQLTTNLRLRAPMSAQLDATIEQTGQMPWRFTLNVPQFDPRGDFLAEDGAIESLAAALTGEGDLTVAQLQGQVEANRQALRVEPARVRFADSVLTIEQLTLIDPAGRGTLNAEGSLRLGGENASPLNADLRVNWIDVQLPAEWVGQPLATRGEIKVLGSPEAFTANGQLALGPPDKLADIAIDIEGSTQRVQLRRLEVFQPRGSLAMQGEVQLQPAIGWQLDARAITFDPGALVAGWPGSIGFTLDTNGQIAPQGPSATLNLRNLNGRLRDRPISAQAQLSLNEQKVIAGTLRANSGNSSVSVTGRGGQALDLNTILDIASLEDWIPMAGGSVRGQFNVSGEWPGIAVKGAAHGSGLAYDGNTVKTVDVTADVSNPQAPSGTLKLTASDIAAKGLKFATAVLDAQGDEMSHTAHLLVSGEPLSAEARVQGARVGVDGWAGTVEQLSLKVADVAALALRAPARVSFDPRQFSVSESCLTGDQISACIAATRDETGQIQARYTLEHLPLSLIAAVTMPDLPLHIDSVIEGNGDLRRTPEGELFGSAQLTSAMGSVSEVRVADDAGAITGLDAEAALLSYQNLLVRAQLEGQTAHADMRMQFNGAGNAVADIAVNNLSGASPVLDGNANITIADLSPLGLFVPQLAEVKGSGELKARIAGTLNAPAITGDAQFRDLAAEVPQIGIKLREGAVQATIREGNDITLAGSVKSGDGVLNFNGSTTADGVLQVSANGADFLAADIPGAKVVVAPDVRFQRSGERMTLDGKVTVPKADIDVAKLPFEQGATQASEDVIVIDDPVEKAARGVPLEVRVTVAVGPDVSLAGYGLKAKVDGQLLVVELPDEPTTASGEIRVSGAYQAYGQDLVIQQGRLLYAGQEISDPQLSLIATRTIETDDVIAKLTVTGSATRPQLEISAEPAMSQTDAVSYLVTGKPVSGMVSGEGDLVQSAARSLGGAAGNLLAQSLGQRLGIADMGVSDSKEIGGSAFYVGRYLSPRLYLSYGVGLFEPGQVVTLRYRVSDRVSVEASQGPLNQRAGIDYRIER